MKGRKNRATGGVNEADEDVAAKPNRRNHAPKIEDAAEERKSGGRAARKRGGMIPGEASACNAGRKPRKSGGRAEKSPFSGAHAGTSPVGHKVVTEMP